MRKTNDVKTKEKSNPTKKYDPEENFRFSTPSKAADKLYLIRSIVDHLLEKRERIKTMKIEWKMIGSDNVVPEVLLELYDSPSSRKERGVDPTESLEV